MLAALAPRLDRFLQAPVDALFRFLDRFFQYTYRETNKGVYALFKSPEKISEAAKAAHARGFTHFDCLTPFPVHGLEFDMGLKRSKVPWITFFAGLTGFFTALALQTGVHEQVMPRIFEFFDAVPNLRSYPLNFGGKPTFSWPPMVPIWFELTVLFGGHTTVAGLILLAKMFRPSRKPLHPSITDDSFCLWIPSDSANYTEDGVADFMKGLGPSYVARVDGDQQTTLHGAA
ncbi:MAG: DUF3341 domain-containing protein [Leptospirales bacterium]|nr:DUF3341 domain-containing protein [Leptospirales bacterium]